jgi:hypothetical protein
MAKNKESFDRRQRALAKKAKANAKRERRLTKDDDGDKVEEPAAPAGDQDAVLARLAQLHAQFEDDAISFDDFETRREELLAQLTVE